MSNECSDWITAEQQDVVLPEFQEEGTKYYLEYTNGLNLELEFCPWCGSELNGLGCTKNKESDNNE